jgi:hypothetical protein
MAVGRDLPLLERLEGEVPEVGARAVEKLEVEHLIEVAIVQPLSSSHSRYREIGMLVMAKRALNRSP